jgi:hypothetical protein
VLRNFTKNEGFTALGQTVYYQLHISRKETAYAWLSYHTGGKFKNNLSAISKDSTLPQKLAYQISSIINYSHVSLGWKHYYKGGSDEEETWSFYSTTGFGLLFAKVQNTFNKQVDTAHYRPLQVIHAGTAMVKRLTVDVGLGVEIPLGPGLFLYSEARTWLPASDYPSAYLYNNNIPRTLLVTAGIRILFD